MSAPKFLRQVQLPLDVDGALWLSAMPGRSGSFAADAAVIEAVGIDRVVRLTPMPEVAAKSPEYLAAIESGEWRWPTVVCEIPDYGVPDDPDALLPAACEVAAALKGGRSVLVHCGAGHGRTGTFAIAVLCALKLDVRIAHRAVLDAGAEPETQEQWRLVEKTAARLAP